EIYGDAPAFGDLVGVPPGDTLTLDMTNIAAPPTLQLGSEPGEGTYFFNTPDTERQVYFQSIETVNATDVFHLLLNMQASGFQNGVADTTRLQLNGTTPPAPGTNLEIYINNVKFF